MRNFPVNRQDGFTLLEVVFAVGILAIGMMGYTALKVSNRYSWVFAKNLTLALHLTNSNLERLRMAGYNDGGCMSAGNHTNADGTCTSAAPALTAMDFTATGASWRVREGCPSKLTKMVTYTTNWQTGGNKQLTITQVLMRP